MKTWKAFALSLVLAAAMLPSVGFAQEMDRKGGGLFGLGAKTDDSWFLGRGLFPDLDVDGIYNQTYGSDQDGFGITNQTYGQNEEAPLGSGLLIMAAAAMGYAAMKRNKKQTKKARQ